MSIEEGEANANADRLMKLPELSEWSCEYSADRWRRGGGGVFGDDSESVDVLQRGCTVLCTRRTLIVSLQKSATL